ncbi:FhaA domain-containing protein [Nocardioides yefusunii]|uniref:FhaA domain-containing protein n=1 Tax=Nocardioides yefusunii TaxID=2500546 RepID=A0ABW1QZ49_9ACTN|nr:DUF3662 and FHA domain-containing protein [Nocardioides yefusunii]
MGALQRFEQRLEDLVSGVFARAFRSAVQPVELSAALQREVDNNSQILSRDRRLVPNDFRVELSAADFERLAQYDDAMARDLAEQLEEHAAAQGYVFPGDVSIAFDRADDLTTGRFRILSAAKASVTGPQPPARQRLRTPDAVLEINGTRHPLLAPGLVIGRGSEADIRINDPGVSRKHVEFEISTHPDGTVQVVATDLGSTNGMTVNGHSMTRAALREGTVVRIGNTDIVVHIEPERS